MSNKNEQNNMPEEIDLFSLKSCQPKPILCDHKQFVKVS